jgi:hypothetical protein
MPPYGRDGGGGSGVIDPTSIALIHALLATGGELAGGSWLAQLRTTAPASVSV